MIFHRPIKIARTRFGHRLLRSNPAAGPLKALGGAGAPSTQATLILILLIASASPFAQTPSKIQFKDVTSRTGISFRHTDGGTGERYIVESVSCGLALLDYDGDGDIDIYFLNGTGLGGHRIEPPPRNVLYRNEGGWRFTDVTEAAGVGDPGYGLGVCAGDFDNDGDPDLYLNNFGPNVLYRNNGDGSFSDITREAGVSNGDKVGAGACFFDFDNDGDLDLYVGNYVDFTCERNIKRNINGYPAYVGPMMYGPVPDTLYRNNGDGTFTDVSVESGIANHKGTSMGMVASDYDNDGDMDVVIGNDAMANFVMRNDGRGRFDEIGLFTGLAYDLHGIGQGTMGVESADMDNDGLLDFYMTSYQKQWATLYRNLGNGFFEDATYATGAGTGTLPQVTWGVGLADFDNDGFRDIYVACGHLQDTVEHWDDSADYLARNVLLANNGRGKFTDISSISGDGLMVEKSSRGAAFDDLDNDGDLDAVILNSRSEPTLLRNDTPPGNHWVRVHLKGAAGNRDGIGAKIKLKAGDLKLVDEVRSGRSYQSHYGFHPHFGLGSNERIEYLEVHWLNGSTSRLTDVQADRVIEISEGEAGK